MLHRSKKKKMAMMNQRIDLLLRVISQTEGEWTVQQQGNDLLCPQVLNDLGELGQELEVGVVGVASMAHDIFAIGL